jgi:zinc protease
VNRAVALAALLTFTGPQAAWSSGTLAPAAQAKESLPPPAPPRPVTLPTPTERRLPNGLRVIVVPKRGTGLVSVVLSVKGAGAAGDPADKAGLANFTASLLTRGTSTRSATQIAREIEELGGTLAAGAGWDSATVNLSVLRANLAAGLAVMADVTLHPSFRPEEVARRRAQALDDLKVSLEDPDTLARLAASRVVFGSAEYGHSLEGTPQSLPRLTRTDAASFYARRFGAPNAALVFGGDITPEEAFALAEKEFDAWRGGVPARDAATTRRPAPPLAGQVVVIDKPDAGQAAVVVARSTVTRSAQNYYAVLLANDVLGGGYSSRLNQEVRVRRGLAYGAGSYVAARRRAGLFVASSQTKNESAAEVARLMLDELRRLVTAPPTEGALATRKAAASGEYARALESGGGLAAQTAALAALEVPLSDLAGYLSRVQAVSVSEAVQAAASRLPVAGTSVVIVGDARRFLPDVRRRFKGMPVVVIPVSRLDLNRAELRRR